MSSPSENVRFIVAVSRGILRDQGMRRSVLFGLVLGAMLMVFAGSVLLDSWLEANAFWFLLFWGVCMWLTLTSFFLAFYDLLAVRRDAARERHQLKADALKDGDNEQPR